MALARAAVADGDDSFAPLDVVRARQFQQQHFVQRWQGQEVEAVEAFDGREPRRLDAPLDRAALAINHLHLGQPHQVTGMVDAFSRTQPGDLVVLPQERRPVSYTHLRAHETDSYLVCRLLLEKKKKKQTTNKIYKTT